MSNVEYSNLRADAPSAEPASESSLTGKLREFCVTWERSVKTICLYPSSNPLPDEFRRKFHDTLDDLLDETGKIALTIGDTSLMYGEDEVYQRDTTDDNLAYLFFRDGICRLEFKEGVTFEESCAFLNVLAEIYSTPGSGGHVANRLWEEALTHIRHYTLDRVVEGTYIEPANDEQLQVRHQQFTATGDAVAETTDEPAESDQPAAPPYRGVQQERFAYLMEVFGEVSGLTEAEQSELAGLADTNSTATCERLGLEILFEILRTTERPRLIEDTIAVIEKQFHRAVGADCWGMVKSILENWHASVPQTPASVTRQIKAAQMRAADARHFESLAGYLNANPDCDLGEVRGVLEGFGALALTLITSMLGVLEHKEARLMVCDFLAENGAGAVDLIGGFIHDKRWFVVRNVAKILGDIGNPRAVGFLQRSVNHADARVRMETLHALQRLSGQPAREAMTALLDDPEKKIRLRALRAVGAARVESAGPQLANKIDNASLTNLDVDEMHELFRAYARTAAGSAASRLIQLAKRSPWFGRQRWLPVRLAAISALTACPGANVEAALSGLCGSRQRRVAHAAREAMQRRPQALAHASDVILSEEEDRDEADGCPDDASRH